MAKLLKALFKPAQPPPAPQSHAEVLLEAGRAAIDAGQPEEGLRHIRAAVALEPELVCEPWHLLPHLKAQGRANLRQRMVARRDSWYRAPVSQAHAHVAALTAKPAMRAWISDLGLPLPELYAGPLPLAALRARDLPARYVVKPVNGANNDGVVLVKDGFDHFRNQPLEGGLETYLGALYSREFDAAPHVLVEECLIDIEQRLDPVLVIPRDFKVFTVAGNAAYTRVHDRNARDGRRSLASFDRNGKRLPSTLKGWPEAAEDMALPEGYAHLIEMAEEISRKLPWLLRLDFYLTDRGPVFGEFTTFPNAGLDSTPFSKRTLLQMWELWPD